MLTAGVGNREIIWQGSGHGKVVVASGAIGSHNDSARRVVRETRSSLRQSKWVAHQPDGGDGGPCNMGKLLLGLHAWSAVACCSAVPSVAEETQWRHGDQAEIRTESM